MQEHAGTINDIGLLKPAGNRNHYPLSEVPLPLHSSATLRNAGASAIGARLIFHAKHFTQADSRYETADTCNGRDLNPFGHKEIMPPVNGTATQKLKANIFTKNPFHFEFQDSLDYTNGMSIFSAFGIMFPLVTYLGVIFLRITAWCFIYRNPVYIFKGSGSTFLITTGLIAAVAFICYRIIRPFDSTIKRIKTEGYVPTDDEKRKCLSSYRKFIIAVIVGNIIGFIIGQSTSTIVEAVLGISSLNPFLFGMCLAQSIGVSGVCALITICAINELMGRYRVLLKIQNLEGFEENKNASIRTYLLMTVVVAIYISMVDMICVPAGRLFNGQETGFANLSGYIKDVLLAAFLSIAFSTPPFIIILTGLKGRINNTTRVIQDIASKGDLQQRINLSLLDDFGIMIGSINSLMDKLSAMLQSIQQGTDTVNSSAQELSSISSVAGQAIHKVNAAFDNISSEVCTQNNAIRNASQNANALVDGVNTVIQNVGEQAEALKQNSDSIMRMTENISNVAILAQEADKVSKALLQTSEQGKEALLASVEVISVIEQSSKEVQSVIKQIQSIASQTNLLSMNASIEAAHAGASGAGFSVVANEVRKLAGESAESAKNIQTQMKGMSAKVREGVNTINNAGEAFKVVADQVDKTAHLIGTISSETENQRQGAELTMSNIRELLNSIESLKALTSQQGEYAGSLMSAMDSVLDSSAKTASVITESNSATHDLSNVLSSVENSVNGNLSAVESMKDSVNIFKI